MTTNITTIGASGDYATIAAWLADTDGDLVTDERIEIGEIIDAVEFEETLTLSGATTDTSFYRWLRARSDVRWNQVAGTGAYITGSIDASGEDAFRITGLKLVNDDTGSSIIFTSNSRMEAMTVVDTTGTGIVVDNDAADGTCSAQGCILIGGEGGEGGGPNVGFSDDFGEIVGCTVFGVDNGSGDGTGVGSGNSSFGVASANCVVDFDTPVGANLVSVDATAAAIPGGTASIAPGDIFVNPATLDLRPLPAGPLDAATVFVPGPKPDIVDLPPHNLNERIEAASPWMGYDDPDSRLSGYTWAWTGTQWDEERRTLGRSICNWAGGTGRLWTTTTGIFHKPDWTLSVWLRKTSTSTTRFVVAESLAVGVSPYQGLLLSAGVRPVFNFVNGAGAVEHFLSTGVDIDDQWHHVVVRCSGYVVELYLDGVLKSTVTRTTLTDHSLVRMAIGGIYTSASATYQGCIGDVRIWSRAINDRELLALRTAPWSQYGDESVPLDATGVATVTPLGLAKGLGGAGVSRLRDLRVSFQNENRMADLGTYTPLTVQVPWLEEGLPEGEGTVTLGAQTGSYVLGARAGVHKRMAHIRGISVPREEAARQGLLYQGTMQEGAVTPPKFASTAAGLALLGGTGADTRKPRVHLSAPGMSDTEIQLGDWTQIESGPGRHVWRTDTWQLVQQPETAETARRIQDFIPERESNTLYSFWMHVEAWFYFYPDLQAIDFEGYVAFDDLKNSRWTIPQFPTVEISVLDTWRLIVKNGRAREALYRQVPITGGRLKATVSTYNGRCRTGTAVSFMARMISGAAAAAELAEFEAQRDDRTVNVQLDPLDALGLVEGRFDFRPTIAPQLPSHQEFRADRQRRVRGSLNDLSGFPTANKFTVTGYYMKANGLGGGDDFGFRYHALGAVLGPDGGYPAHAEECILALDDAMSRGIVFHWAPDDSEVSLRKKRFHPNDRGGFLSFNYEYPHWSRAQNTPEPFDYGKELQWEGNREYNNQRGANPFEHPGRGPDFPNRLSNVFLAAAYTNSAHQIQDLFAAGWFLTSRYLFQVAMDLKARAYLAERAPDTTTSQAALQEERSYRHEGRMLQYEESLLDRTLWDEVKARVANRIGRTCQASIQFWSDVDAGYAYPVLAFQGSASTLTPYLFDAGTHAVWFDKLIVPYLWRWAVILDTTEAWRFAHESAKRLLGVHLQIDSPTAPPRRIEYVSLPGRTRTTRLPAQLTAPGTAGDRPPPEFLTAANHEIYHKVRADRGAFKEMDAGALHACFMICQHQGDTTYRDAAALYWTHLLATETPNNVGQLFYENRWQTYEVGPVSVVNRYVDNGGGGGGNIRLYLEGEVADMDTFVSTGVLTAGAAATLLLLEGPGDEPPNMRATGTPEAILSAATAVTPLQGSATGNLFISSVFLL